MHDNSHILRQVGVDQQSQPIRRIFNSILSLDCKSYTMPFYPLKYCSPSSENLEARTVLFYIHFYNEAGLYDLWALPALIATIRELQTMQEVGLHFWSSCNMTIELPH